MHYHQIKKIGLIYHPLPEDENERVSWPETNSIFKSTSLLPYQLIVDPEIQRFTRRAIGMEENEKYAYDREPFRYSNFLDILLSGQLAQVQGLGYDKKQVMARYYIRDWYEYWLSENSLEKYEKEFEEIGLIKSYFSFMRPYTGCLAHIRSCWCDEPTCHSIIALLIQHEKDNFYIPLMALVHQEELIELYANVPYYLDEKREEIYETFTVHGDPIEPDIKEMVKYGLKLDPMNYFDLFD